MAFRESNSSSIGVRKCRGPKVKGWPPRQWVLTPPPRNGARSTRVTSQPPPASSIWCAAAQPAKPPPMIRAFFIAPPGPCSERLPLAPPQLAVVDVLPSLEPRPAAGEVHRRRGAGFRPRQIGRAHV